MHPCRAMHQEATISSTTNRRLAVGHLKVSIRCKAMLTLVYFSRSSSFRVSYLVRVCKLEDRSLFCISRRITPCFARHMHHYESGCKASAFRIKHVSLEIFIPAAVNVSGPAQPNFGTGSQPMANQQFGRMQGNSIGPISRSS